MWFAIDLSFLDVVFFLIFAFMRYLSLSLDERRALFSLSYLISTRLDGSLESSGAVTYPRNGIYAHFVQILLFTIILPSCELLT